MKRSKLFVLSIILLAVLCCFSGVANAKKRMQCGGNPHFLQYCEGDDKSCFECKMTTVSEDGVTTKQTRYYCLLQTDPLPQGYTCSPVGQRRAAYYDETTIIRPVENLMEGCEPIESKRKKIENCILCPMFQVILATDQGMATMAYDSLAAGFRNVIIVVMALFIAYHTFLSISAFTKQDVGRYLQTILIQAFKVLVAALLLSNSDYIYRYLINPLMEAGLEFGLQIIDSEVLKELASYTDKRINEMPTGVISRRLLAQVEGTIRLFSKESANLPLIGGTLICVSCHSLADILPDISLLIEGTLVWAFGWCISVACCFYLLDSVIRFGIFCTLLPFFIACWPFKITFTYAKKGFEIFMNTFFNFVMMGLIISLTKQLILQALTGGEGGADAENAIINALNNNNVETLREMMDLSGAKFMVLLACCIFAFKLVAQVGELASNISDTNGPTGKSNIGGKLGGLAAQGVTNVALGSKDADGHRKGGVLGAAAKVTGVKGVVDGVKDKVGSVSDNLRKKIGGAYDK